MNEIELKHVLITGISGSGGSYLAEYIVQNHPNTKVYGICAVPSGVDSKLLRPADVTLQIPNVEKFKQATGWQPKYSFEESVEHLLNHCRERVKKGQCNKND